MVVGVLMRVEKGAKIQLKTNKDRQRSKRTKKNEKERKKAEMGRTLPEKCKKRQK